MIKQLIVNADDFGMSEGVTLGILKAHQDGIVSSTTVMMNMPYALFALQEAKKFPNLGIGIHLVLTVGKPLIKGNKSFTDENGYFIRPDQYPDHQPHGNHQELYQEWKAQIESFIQTTGRKPTHIDSHHHVHLLPQHIEVAKKLAKEYDIPMRQRDQVLDHYQYVRMDDRFYKDRVTFDFFQEIIDVPDTTIELMCHPAYIDYRLYTMSSYHINRALELDLLTSDSIKNLLRRHHITLINYSDIKKGI